MDAKDVNAKNKIIKATIDLLNEIDEPDKITIREIAERANVGVGLINYHFQTKENLMYKAISDTMNEMAMNLQKTNNKGEEPIQRLKTMLKELTDFALQYNKLSLILAACDLKQGNMQTPLYIVPILKEIYGDNKKEIEIRIIAFEIIATLQAAYINNQTFQLYVGKDIYDKAQRDELIDILVNSIINK